MVWGLLQQALTPCVPTISFPCHVPDRLLCLADQDVWRPVKQWLLTLSVMCAHRINYPHDRSGLPSRSVLANTLPLLSQGLSFFLFFFVRFYFIWSQFIFITYYVLQSLWFCMWHNTSPVCLLFCESQLSVLFSSVWLSVTINTSFTFCKVKLIIMILLSWRFGRTDILI